MTVYDDIHDNRKIASDMGIGSFVIDSIFSLKKKLEISHTISEVRREIANLLVQYENIGFNIYPIEYNGNYSFHVDITSSTSTKMITVYFDD